MPVRRSRIVFLLIMAAAVAEAVQVVGVLLILTLLITPGAWRSTSRLGPGAPPIYSVGSPWLRARGGFCWRLSQLRSASS